MTRYSFSQIGRNWGRSLSAKCTVAGRIQKSLDLFPRIHERFVNVQVENQDWYNCLMDYDGPDAVFYLDPPYVDVHAGAHKHIMTHNAHRRMLETIFSLQGFVAMSGYPNPLYDSKPWDDRHEWDSFVSIKAMAYTEGNAKKGLENEKGREHTTEILWIKESQ